MYMNASTGIQDIHGRERGAHFWLIDEMRRNTVVQPADNQALPVVRRGEHKRLQPSRANPRSNSVAELHGNGDHGNTRNGH
ncbi:hypothetical protein M378DRAFT_155371 [Amanita muscaria Koide BX008]|uniref:Uncharacterized protein n=1 Tax=Amanita muscaria (strain Koide BX008) TaxID=946122 RepID=A0A0C2TWE2_AMAMK|nr:hypothetical protein M378DRAFT_155371 [Amanita muscaria Koide BX008]